jgi:O-antigen ligase
MEIPVQQATTHTTKLITSLSKSWGPWLLKVLIFSVFGLLFIQPRYLPLTTLLMLLGFFTALMHAGTRRALLDLFGFHKDSGLFWISWPFLVWFFAAILTAWCSSQLYDDFFPPSHFYPLRFPVSLCLLALAVVWRPQALWLLIGLIAAAVTAAVYCVYGLYITQGHGIRNWIELPVRFGNWSMLAAGLLVIFGALSTHARILFRIALLVTACLAIFASIIAGTRSSMIVLLVLTVILLAVRKDHLHRWLVGLGVAGIILSSTLILSVPSLQKSLRLTELKQDFVQTQEGDYATSFGARIIMWRAAWEIFKRHPYTGAGPKSFKQELASMVERGEVPRIPIYAQAHSDVLHILATAGLIGLIAYMGIIVGPIFFFGRFLYHAKDNPHLRLYAAAGLLVTISFFCFGLTNATLFRAFDSTTYSLLICALAAQLLRSSTPQTSTRERLNKYTNLA